MEEKRCDRRVLMSKKLLKGGLIDLLHSKSINEITIKEICARANINRTTFYNHYSSQYELYEDIICDVFDVIHKYQQEFYSNGKNLSNAEATRGFLISIFEYAEENIDLFLVILGKNGYINIGEAFTKYIDTFIRKEHTSTYSRYTIQFISAGISNTLWMWLNEPIRMPATDLAAMFSTLYTNGLEKALKYDDLL